MNVYDFDNTLYKGESSYDFFFFCLKRKPKMIKYIPVVLKHIYNYKKLKIDFEQLINSFNEIFNKIFKTEQELNELSIKFWDKNIYKLKDLVNNLTTDDIIITGSPDFLMNIIKDKLNVKEIISTKINNRKIEFLCLGENKVKIFKELYPNKKINNFYTDSMNDLPLMKLSNNVYLVKGNKIEKMTK